MVNRIRFPQAQQRIKRQSRDELVDLYLKTKIGSPEARELLKSANRAPVSVLPGEHEDDE